MIKRPKDFINKNNFDKLLGNSSLFKNLKNIFISKNELSDEISDKVKDITGISSIKTPNHKYLYPSSIHVNNKQYFRININDINVFTELYILCRSTDTDEISKKIEAQLNKFILNDNICTVEKQIIISGEKLKEARSKYLYIYISEEINLFNRDIVSLLKASKLSGTPDLENLKNEITQLSESLKGELLKLPSIEINYIINGSYKIRRYIKTLNTRIKFNLLKDIPNKLILKLNVGNISGSVNKISIYKGNSISDSDIIGIYDEVITGLDNRISIEVNGEDIGNLITIDIKSNSPSSYSISEVSLIHKDSKPDSVYAPSMREISDGLNILDNIQEEKNNKLFNFYITKNFVDDKKTNIFGKNKIKHSDLTENKFKLPVYITDYDINKINRFNLLMNLNSFNDLTNIELRGYINESSYLDKSDKGIKLSNFNQFSEGINSFEFNNRLKLRLIEIIFTFNNNHHMDITLLDYDTFVILPDIENIDINDMIISNNTIDDTITIYKNVSHMSEFLKDLDSLKTKLSELDTEFKSKYNNQQLAIESIINSYNELRDEVNNKPDTFSIDVGDDKSKSIRVTHQLDSKDVVTQVTENVFPYQMILCDVEIIDTNNIYLKFNKAPTKNQYRVTIVG